jgi:Tfp pilus assembly protein PilX
MKSRLTPAKLKNNEEGNALIIVLLAVVVISVLGLSMMSLTASNLKMTTVDRNYQSVFYTAESGITLMESQFKQTASTVCSNASSLTTFVSSISDQSNTFQEAYFSKINGLQPKAAVTGKVIGRDATNGLVTIQIQSQGTVGDSSRKLTKTIQVKCTPGSNGSPLAFINDMAVFTNNNIYFSSTINGNIGTNCVSGNCSGLSPITVDWGAKLTGSINAPNASSTIYKKPSSMTNFNPKLNNIPSRSFGSSGPYNPPDFPVYPTNLPKRPDLLLTGGSTNDQTISADGYYDQITLQSGRTLTINVGSENRTIVVNKLHMDQGFIKIIGNKTSTGKLIGSLTLYIGDEFVFGGTDKKGIPTGSGSSTINLDGDSSKVNIYYKGTQLLNIGGDIKVNANVYVLNANITLGGSGSIVGNIIAKNATEIDITGGSNSVNHFILAPNATVNVNGGATVTGSVISNNFNLTGGATLNYGKIDDTGGVSFYPPSSNSSAAVTLSPTVPVKEINN